jgi:hypothetical protein
MSSQQAKTRSKEYLIPLSLCKQKKKNSIIGKKKEKSNTSLNYCYEKNKIQIFLINEKRMLFYYNLNIKKKTFKVWDNKRKLICLTNQSEYFGIILAQKYYIHIEEFLCFNIIRNQISSFKKSPPKMFGLLLKAFKSYLSFQQILLFISLKKFELMISRFYLRNKFVINPNYICWSKKKNFNFIFNIILYQTNTTFSSYFSIISLLAKIKPGLLKLAYFGLTSFVFFSIEAGVFIDCPFYAKKKVVKKKL